MMLRYGVGLRRGPLGRGTAAAFCAQWSLHACFSARSLPFARTIRSVESASRSTHQLLSNGVAARGRTGGPCLVDVRRTSRRNNSANCRHPPLQGC